MEKRNLYSNELSEVLELEGQNFIGDCLGNKGIEEYLKEKADNQATSELLKEFYEKQNGIFQEMLTTVDEGKIAEHNKYINKAKQEIINQYLVLNGKTLAKLSSLRDTEWRDINRECKEFQKFKASLGKNERITSNGYLIYRKEIEVRSEGLPGFEDEVHYEYEYGQCAEDLTILFGTDEYCKKYHELMNSIISWDQFLKDYYDTPYEYWFMKKH